MPAIRQARSAGLGNLVAAGALALGVSGPLPLHAEEPGGAAKSSPRAGVQATGPPSREPDAHSLRARWRAQQIASRKAEAVYHIARLTREIAEIALPQYEEVIVAEEVAAVDGEIKLAESDLKLAEDSLDYAKKTFYKGFPPSATEFSHYEFAVRKAKFALEQAQGKKKVLVDYTQPKRIKELKSKIEKARSNELTQKAAWEREKASEAELERQVGQPQVTNAKPESR